MSKKMFRRFGSLLLAGLMTLATVVGDVVPVYADELIVTSDSDQVISEGLDSENPEAEVLLEENNESALERDNNVNDSLEMDSFDDPEKTGEVSNDKVVYESDSNDESVSVNVIDDEGYDGLNISPEGGCISMSSTEYDNKVNGFIREYSSGYPAGMCAYYGNAFTNYMYGISNYLQGGDEFHNINEIRAGDVIRLNADEMDGSGHTFVVLYRNGNDLYTAEGGDSYFGNNGVRIESPGYRIVGNYIHKIHGGIDKTEYVGESWMYAGHHYVNIFKDPTPHGVEMKEGRSRTIPNGYYQIISAVDHTAALDVPGTDKSYTSKNDYVNARVWHNRGSANDIFYLEYQSDGFYSITHADGGWALDAEGNGDIRGNNVGFWKPNNEHCQDWAITEFSDGKNNVNKWYRIQNRHSGYFLDVKDGNVSDEKSNVILWEENKLSPQNWSFVPYAPKYGQKIANGSYHIISEKNGNWCLGTNNTGDNSYPVNVVLRTDTNAADTAFKLTYDSNQKYYTITNEKQSKYKYLDIQTGGYSTKNVGLWTANPGTSLYDTVQRWIIVPNGTSYNIVNSLDGYFIDIEGGGNVSNPKDKAVNIQVHTCNNGSWQRWKFVRAVDSVSISKTSATVNIGSNLTLTAAVSPSAAVNKSITWTSSNTNVATVNNSGVVTPKAVGTATITVKTADGGYTASCKVTVSAISVTGVTLNKSNTTIVSGNTESLTATVSPSNAANKNVTWSSSNTNVATVNSSGVVTAKSEGTANITVKTNDGGKTAICKVTVVTVPMITTSSLPNGEVGKNYSATLTASGTTPIYMDKTAGSLPDGLTLNSNGVVSGKPTKSGSFVVTVQAKNKYGNSPAKQLTITIGGVAPKITTEYKYGVGSIAIRAAEEGKSYSFTFTADGTSPLRWSIVGGTSLPDGLALITSTGQIYGPPTTVGGKTFKVRVENDYGYDEKDFFINVYTNVPRIVTESLPDGVAGEKYVADLDNTNYDVDGDISKLYVSAGTQLNEWLNDAELIHNAWHNSRITGIPKKAGVFTFTLTVENSYGKSSKQFTVNVKPSKAEPKPVNDEIKGIDSTIVAGQKIDLKEVCFANVNASISRYVVDNKSIASVSKTMLSGIKAGTVTVTAQTKVDKNTYEDVAACKVTVLNKPKLKFSRTMTYDGQTMRASDYFTTDDTNIIGATYWESSKPAVVEVIDAKTGTIRAHKNGSASISAYFGEKGKAGTLKVTATVNVKVPAFQKNEYKMQTGADLVLSMKNVVKTQNPAWVTDNGSVATAAPQFDKNGNPTGKVVVKGLNYGDTILTATIDGQNYRCVIHVAAPRISKTSLTVKKGKTATLSLQNTKYKKSQINWKSSNESIVTVDANGKVKGISAGEAVIYTTTGGIRNECVVTVK